MDKPNTRPQALAYLAALIFLVTAPPAAAELFPLGPELRIGGGEGHAALGTGPRAVAASPLQQFLAVRSESGIFTFSGTDIAATLWNQNGLIAKPLVSINRKSENEQRSPQVCAQQSTGNFVIIWSDEVGNGDFRIRGQLLSGDGHFQSQELDIDTGIGGADEPTLACALANATLVAWNELDNVSETSEILVRLLNHAGEAVTEPIAANADTPLQRGRPHAAANGLGKMVVTWTDTVPFMTGYVFNTKARIFTAAGTPLGNELAVNADDGSPAIHKDPVAVVRDDGAFTIIWEGERSSGTVCSDILGRGFNAQGEPLTGEIVVNQILDSCEGHPAVEKLPDGKLLVVWASGIDGNGRGISARVLNADLSPSSDEFRVNATAEGDQERPGVAVDATGDILITWSSVSGAGAHEVYAQRYASAEPRCGAPVTSQSSPSASDCLFILRASVGAGICDPECLCAPSGTLPPRASDALLCLTTAVGVTTPDAFNCPCGA